jgi:hypothetical protein
MAQLLHGLKANAERGAHDTGQHDCQCGVLLTGTEQGGEGWGRDTWNGGDARSRGGAGTRESRKNGVYRQAGARGWPGTVEGDIKAAPTDGCGERRDGGGLTGGGGSGGRREGTQHRGFDGARRG